MSGIRAFVALEMPALLRARIGALMDELRPRLPGLRFLSPETVHLTLRFLGEASPESLERLAPLLAAAGEGCGAREIGVSGLGTFPDRGSPRVLWLGADLPPELLELQHACEEAARGCGFPKEDKPFRSHVTLGRWRDRARRPDLPPADFGRVALDSLVLYKSDLGPRGAVHTPLASFRLK